MNMSMITKLFEVWTLSKTISAATSMLMRLLAGVAAIVICVILAAILLAVLLIGAVLVAYRQLVISGMDPQMAALLIGAILLAMLAGVVLYAKKHLNQLRVTSRSLVNFKAPGTDNVVRLIDAFMEGFESVHKPK